MCDDSFGATRSATHLIEDVKSKTNSGNDFKGKTRGDSASPHCFVGKRKMA